MIRIEPITVDVAEPVVPIRVPVWAWLMVLAAIVLVYFAAIENGATLRHGATFLHEFFHDGRHFLSFPCH